MFGGDSSKVTAAMNRTKTVVRLFWPDDLFISLSARGIQSCVLLGPVMHCQQVDNTQLVVAAVVSWCLPAALEAFSARSVTLDLAGQPHAATLAALGTWSSADDPCSPPHQAAAIADLWLVLRGSQQLCDALCSSSSSTRDLCQQLPGCCSLNQSRLPAGTGSLQVFAYRLPAGPWCQPPHQQQQQQHQGAPSVAVPWLIRDPGGATLAAVMQLLSQAQDSIRRAQQAPQQETDAGWSALAALNSRQQQPLPRQRLPAWWNRRHPSAQLLPALWQHLLGLAAALALLQHRVLLLEVAGQAGERLQQQVLQPHVDWLMQAHPAGIKLHVELSILLGTAATHVLQLSGSCCAAAWPWLGPAALATVAAAAALGGVSIGCAAAADVLLLLAWPLVAVYCWCAWLHRLQLRCLAATWRLVRGKQKVRRFSERFRHKTPDTAATTPAAGGPCSPASPASTAVAGLQPGGGPADGDEVSVEQLIVGVLLLTPLLGLLPTTAAWYLSVCCCQAALLAVRRLLLAAGQLLRMHGLRLLVERWRQPEQFPGELLVQPLRAPGPAGAIHSKEQQSAGLQLYWYRVFYQPCSYTSLLQQQCCAGATAAAVAAGGGSSGALIGLEKALKGKTWGLLVYLSK